MRKYLHIIYTHSSLFSVCPIHKYIIHCIQFRVLGEKTNKPYSNAFCIICVKVFFKCFYHHLSPHIVARNETQEYSEVSLTNTYTVHFTPQFFSQHQSFNFHIYISSGFLPFWQGDIALISLLIICRYVQIYHIKFYQI